MLGVSFFAFLLLLNPGNILAVTGASNFSPRRAVSLLPARELSFEVRGALEATNVADLALPLAYLEFFDDADTVPAEESLSTIFGRLAYTLTRSRSSGFAWGFTLA